MKIFLRGSKILFPTLKSSMAKIFLGFPDFCHNLINIHENTNNLIFIEIHDINNFVKWYNWCNNNVSQWYFRYEISSIIVSVFFYGFDVFIKIHEYAN